MTTPEAVHVHHLARRRSSLPGVSLSVKSGINLRSAHIFALFCRCLLVRPPLPQRRATCDATLLLEDRKGTNARDKSFLLHQARHGRLETLSNEVVSAHVYPHAQAKRSSCRSSSSPTLRQNAARVQACNLLNVLRRSEVGFVRLEVRGNVRKSRFFFNLFTSLLGNDQQCSGLVDSGGHLMN